MKARYKSIVDIFADRIRNGDIPSGTRLPTHRALSAQEHISLATATRVYTELEAMGLVSGETGRGTFVREISLPYGHGIDQHAVATDVLDLNFNYPSLPGQGELLREALRQVAASGDIESLLRYQPHAGRMTEREIIAAHIAGPGFQPEAENVVIVNGAQHGLTITVMGMLRPGDVVAVDALTYPGFKVLAELYHLELIAIPALADGPDLSALEALCQKRHVRAVYTMPTLHNPLGWLLSHSQRKKMADIARKYDLLVIEDTAYGYLIRRPPPPVASYAPERTVYITGFSKNVATGLRVGAVVCPTSYRPALERAVRATTWNTPSVMTTLVCNWIQDGTVARFETLKRRDARQRQAELRCTLGDIPCIAHPNSYFAWLPLPDDARADRVARALMDCNISVSTAEPFCTSLVVPQALRLALGSIAIEKLHHALLKVREAVQSEQYR
ncbi:PLP-dependent aminotransferase family protein [Klebsiella sp. BIGb0407]|uniref:aminotransferase-like domain-containing protein n=1 Tax=Klebsiella sp. BIGb0407 TaxID=2940603 RepID=UPI002167D000|nr:PLP-dependent aminotransferase family protein [Klebsiella sp. BIGb0407]MCS3429851.1 DNA-binding transcriptional MocR family regulator [Klebsiella sp. BIGb0407]